MVAIALGIALLAVARASPFLQQLSGLGADIAEVSSDIIDVPKQLLNTASAYLESRQTMRQRIQELEDKQLMLSARAQKMEALTAENMR